jgi:glycosyltransferase involved in cell wall biosynthesis
MSLMEKMAKNRSRIYVGNLICFFAILLMYIVPQTRIIPLYNYIQISLFAIWLITAFCLFPAYFKTNNRHIFLFGFYSIYILSASLFTHNEAMFRRFFGLVFFLLVYIAFHFYQTNHPRILRKFTLFGLVLMPIFNIISILFVINMPYVVRNVFNETSHYYQYLKFGVVGYDYVFSLVIIIPIIIYALWNEENFTMKVRQILWLNLITGGLLILLSGYTLAILILSIGCGLIYVIRKFNRKHIRRYLFICAGLVLLFPLIVFFLNILLAKTAYASKIEILVNFLRYGVISGGILDARIIAYGKSLATILKFPLTGLIYHAKIILSSTSGELIQVGQHSAILDSAAVFGLPLLALLLYMIFHPIKTMYTQAKSNPLLSALISACGVMLFLILLLNNDIPFLSFAVYFGLGNAILLASGPHESKVYSNDVLYIGFYDDIVGNRSEKRNTFLSSVNKMNYITQVLVDEGYHVTILSPAWTMLKKGYFAGKEYDLDKHVRLALTPTFGSKYRILRTISKAVALVWMGTYLLLHTNGKSRVLVYHAQLTSIPILFAKFVRKFKITLELEEIYHLIQPSGKLHTKLEMMMIASAKAYILPNNLIYEKIRDPIEKPRIVVHGDYRIAQEYAKDIDWNIKLLFAGNIEKIRGGAFNALKIIDFLDDSYILHIIGYGSESELAELGEAINVINSNRDREVIKYHGVLYGIEFSEFLSGCDIALNLQTQSNHYMDMAFPSKVISYLAHGLHVVSTRLNTLENSEISRYITFVDELDPASIAKKIESIDLYSEFDPKAFLKDLDVRTHTDLGELMKRVY